MLLKSIRRMNGLRFEGQWKWAHRFLLVIWLSLLAATPPRVFGYFLGDTKAVLNGCKDHWTLQDRAAMPLLFQMTVCVDIRVVVPGAWVAFSYSSVHAPRPELGLEGDDGALYGWLLRVRHRFPLRLSPTDWHRVCLRRDVLGNSFSLEVDGKMVAERTVIARAIPPSGSLWLGCRPRDRPPGAVLGEVEVYLFRIWADLGDHGPCEDGTVIGWNAQFWGLTSPNARQRDPKLMCDHRRLKRGAHGYKGTNAHTTKSGRAITSPDVPSPSTTSSPVIATTVTDPTNQTEFTVSTSPGVSTVYSSQSEPPSVTPSTNVTSPTTLSALNPTTASSTDSTTADWTPSNTTGTVVLDGAPAPVSPVTSHQTATTDAMSPTSRSLTSVAYFWMFLSVEAKGGSKTEQDVRSLVSKAFGCGSDTDKAMSAVKGFIDFCQGNRQTQGIEVDCSEKRNFSKTNCHVLLSLTHAVSACEVQLAGISALQQAEDEQIQATIIREVERVGRDLCGDMSPHSGGFVRCTSSSSLDDICQANQLSNFTCSLLESNSTPAPQPKTESCGRKALFCDCIAFCSSASHFFAIRININSAAVNVSLLEKLLSNLSLSHLCDTETGSECQEYSQISKHYKTAQLECHGTQHRLYSCMVIMEMSGPVDGCSLSKLLKQLIDSNSDITNERPLTRMVVCGSPGLPVHTLLASNLTWVASDLLISDICQPDPTLLKCEANETLAVLLSDSCPPKPLTTNPSTMHPSTQTNSDITTATEATPPTVNNTTQQTYATSENTPATQQENASQGTTQPNMTTPFSVFNSTQSSPAQRLLQTSSQKLNVTVSDNTTPQNTTSSDNATLLTPTGNTKLQNTTTAQQNTSESITLSSVSSTLPNTTTSTSNLTLQNTTTMRINSTLNTTTLSPNHTREYNVTTADTFTPAPNDTTLYNATTADTFTPSPNDTMEYNVTTANAFTLTPNATTEYNVTTIYAFTPSPNDKTLHNATTANTFPPSPKATTEYNVTTTDAFTPSPNDTTAYNITTTDKFTPSPNDTTLHNATTADTFPPSLNATTVYNITTTDKFTLSPNNTTLHNASTADTFPPSPNATTEYNVTKSDIFTQTPTHTTMHNMTTADTFTPSPNHTMYNITTAINNGNLQTSTNSTSNPMVSTFTTSPNHTTEYNITTASNNHTTKYNITTASNNYTTEYNVTTASNNYTTEYNVTTASNNYTTEYNVTTPSNNYTTVDNKTAAISNGNLHNSTSNATVSAFTTPTNYTTVYNITTASKNYTTAFNNYTTVYNVTTASSNYTTVYNVNTASNNYTTEYNVTTASNNYTTEYNVTTTDAFTPSPNDKTLHNATTANTFPPSPKATTEYNVTTTEAFTPSPNDTTVYNITTTDKFTPSPNDTTLHNATTADTFPPSLNATTVYNITKSDIFTQTPTHTTMYNMTTADTFTPSPNHTMYNITTAINNGNLQTSTNSTSNPMVSTFTTSPNHTTEYNITTASNNHTTEYNVTTVSNNYTTVDNKTAAISNGNLHNSTSNATISAFTTSPNYTTVYNVNTASNNYTKEYDVTTVSNNYTTVDNVNTASNNYTTEYNVTRASDNYTTKYNVTTASNNYTTEYIVTTASNNYTTEYNVTTASNNYTTAENITTTTISQNKTNSDNVTTQQNTTVSYKNTTVSTTARQVNETLYNATTATKNSTVDNMTSFVDNTTKITVAPLNNQKGNYTTVSVPHNSMTTNRNDTNSTAAASSFSPITNLNTTAGTSFNLSSTASSLTTDFYATTKGPAVNLTIAANTSLEHISTTSTSTMTTTATTVHGPLPAQDNTTTTMLSLPSTTTTTTLQTTTPTSTTNTIGGTEITSIPTEETTNSQVAQAELADGLLNETQDASQLNSSQVGQLVGNLEKLLDGPAVSQTVGKKTINIVSNLMQADSQALSASANRLIRVVDILGLKLAVTGDRAILSSKSLVLAVRTVDGTNFPTTSVNIFNTNNVQFRGLSRSQSGSSEPAMGSVFLPSFLTEGLSPEDQQQASRVQFTYYTKSAFFQDAALKNQTLVSPVLASSVANMSISNLTENIQFTILNTNPIHANFVASCVFWDFTLNGGGGGWSSAGCSLVNATPEDTTCSCNHLTSFAILIDISRQGITDRQQAQILTFITYIGCGVSAIFLAVTMLTYLSFQKLLRDIPAKILVQLCMSLFLLNLVYLLDGWLALYPVTGLCISTAFFLHYFLLTSFTWAGLEALHMYLSIVQVFTPYLSRYMLKFTLMGWGIPLIVVIVVISVDKDNYGLVKYGKYTDGTSDDFCWLKNEIAFYVGVVAYFILIFVLCLLVFIVVMVQLARIKKQNPQNQSPSRGVMTDLRSITGLILLLGLTWGFALFAWGPLYLPFVYLFSIFNSLQGFFIFVFHCAAKENVRRQWRTYLCCGKLRLAENSEWSRTATQNNRKLSVTAATTSALHLTSRSSSVISDSTNSSGSVFVDSGISDGSNSDVVLNELQRRNLSLQGEA